MNNNETKIPNIDELDGVVELVAQEARKYFANLDTRLVRIQGSKEVLASFEINFPEDGMGTSKTLMKLIQDGIKASVASSGPRFFHFVIGGVTPAAFGAEWIAVVLDQLAYAYVTSPLAVKLEILSLNWLKDIFEIPQSWGGIMTTGATMAMYVGLAAARQWYGEQFGINVFEDGIASLGKVPIFASDILHASGVKVLSLLGFGSKSIQKIANKSGTFDLEELEKKLINLNSPSIIVAVAGEPNAGFFDPIPELVELAKKYNAWLHIDGAFGMFAKILPETSHLLKNSEMARSISVDGHKWLNVPYDCGFSFVSDQTLMAKAFRYSADYLPDSTDDEHVFGIMGPESSRRARSLAVWATLHAYGKSGLRHLIKRNLDHAKYLYELIEASTNFETLAELVLNVVCFRYNPGNKTAEQLDVLNTTLGTRILEDGRVYLGTTKFEEKVALRPAIVNWRTKMEDIKYMVDVVEELATKIDEQFHS